MITSVREIAQNDQGYLLLPAAIGSLQSAEYNGPYSQMAAAAGRQAAQSAKLQEMDKKLDKTNKQFDFNADLSGRLQKHLSESAIALQKAIENANSEFDQFQKDNDLKTRQLETKLKDLTLANRELEEKILQMAARANQLKGRVSSNPSFFGDSRAPSVINEEDN